MYVLIRLSPDKNWRAKEGWKGKTGTDGTKPPFFTLPMVPCTSSPVTRVSRSPLFETMQKTKRLRRRLDRGDTRLYLPLNMKSMERLFNTVFRTFSRKNK